MRLRPGQQAPQFSARSDDGQLVSLEGLRGQWVVLYFFRRALTEGCTLEARQFQASLPALSELGAQVVGVSSDTEARQALFRERHRLSFPLIPDGAHDVGARFGALGLWGRLSGLYRRQTYLIDPSGRVAWRWGRVRPAGHAAEVLSRLRLLRGQAQAGRLVAAPAK